MTTTAERLWRRLGGPRALLWTTLAVALLATGDLVVRGALSAGSAGTAGAAWVWASATDEPFTATSFFAVRDFALEAAPASARLRALADEEALLFLNGSAVGSLRYAEGAELAVWEVSELLRPGVNRLVAELRSGRGVGGFLLSLEAETGSIVTSDSTWRIVRRFDDQLLEPGAPLADAELPRVWAEGATGRWGAPAEGPERPLLRDAVASSRGVFAPRVRRLASTEWIELGPPEGGSPAIGDRVIFDWGREVVGYPSVIFAGTDGAKALLWAGLEPPGAAGPVTSYVLKAPGRRSWTDSQPLRLRYLIVHSTRPVAGAGVFELGGAARDALGERPRPVGAFGLEPALSVPAVENEIRRELEGVARIAGG